MPLLADYAITPDVFDTTSYASEEDCGERLSEIRRVLMNEGLVRDLRAGEWGALFAGGGRSWHRRAKEIMKKLAKQGRLINFPSIRPDSPDNDQEWCAEALAGHQQEPITGGVIATRAVKDAYPRERLVERIDQLSKALWWTERSPSVRLDRKIEEYRHHLQSILRCANSLLFIDPHLDPRRHGYREFADLLACAARRRPTPLIEIHRVCYVGAPHDREFPDFEPIFGDNLAGPLRAAGLRAEVFVWDDFHDRYLLSNLIGISLPNGFDTTRRRNDITTWTRLGRDDRDNVQREFDEASGRHALRARFTLE